MEFNRVTDTLLGVLSMAVNITGSVSNAYFLIHLVKDRKALDGKNVTALLFIQIAIADLVTCLIPSTVCALGLLNGRQLPFNSVFLNDVFGWLLSAVPITSLYIIGVMTSARMFAVYHSLHYKRLFTVFKVLTMSLGCWVLGALYSSTPFFAGKHYTYAREVSMIAFSATKEYLEITDPAEKLLTGVTICMIDIPLFVVTISCIGALLKLRSPVVPKCKPPKPTPQELQVKRRANSALTGALKLRKKDKRSASYGSGNATARHNQPLAPHTNVKDTASITIMLMMMCFIVCYLPGGVVRLLFFLNELGIIRGSIVPVGAGRRVFLYGFYVVNLLLIAINSCLNPFLYYFRVIYARAKNNNILIGQRKRDLQALQDPQTV